MEFSQLLMKLCHTVDTILPKDIGGTLKIDLLHTEGGDKQDTLCVLKQKTPTWLSEKQLSISMTSLYCAQLSGSLSKEMQVMSQHGTDILSIGHTLGEIATELQSI